jgi:hydroxyacylglutathione hydrolase
MTLEIMSFVLGPLENNSFLLADLDQKVAVAIDPSFDSETIFDLVENKGWSLQEIWITHGHFDHIAGARPLSSKFHPPIPIGLHPLDYDIWKDAGEGPIFGFHIETGPLPDVQFFDGQNLIIGNHVVEVRHTPGHTRGHVTFYCPDAGTAFCGDVIFSGSIGRTDLPGGNIRTLFQSIEEKILTLPPKTKLLCGHGPETTVEVEMATNPFLH